MGEGTKDSELESQQYTAFLNELGFVELPCVVEGHRNFIVNDLMDRYLAGRDSEEDVYVAILHKKNNEHYILGIYTSMREALQTRYVTNIILNGGGKFSEAHFVQAHYIAGPVVDNMVFDAKQDDVKPFNPEPMK